MKWKSHNKTSFSLFCDALPFWVWSVSVIKLLHINFNITNVAKKLKDHLFCDLSWEIIIWVFFVTFANGCSTGTH
jgi:hypothetical protein